MNSKSKAEIVLLRRAERAEARADGLFITLLNTNSQLKEVKKSLRYLEAEIRRLIREKNNALRALDDVSKHSVTLRGRRRG